MKYGSRRAIGVGAAISLIVLIIGPLATVYAIYLTYPRIDVQMHFTDQNLMSSSNVESIIQKDDARYTSLTSACFQITNEAETLFNYDIPANNFKVFVRTNNANCANCDSNTPLEVLSAQEKQKVCRRINVPENTESFTIEIDTKWNALGQNGDATTTFDCNTIEDLGNRIKFNCDRK